MKAFYKDIEKKIQQAIKEDIPAILEKVGNERIYTVALVTDSDCVTLFLALNTYEYLEKRDKEYAEEMDLSEEVLKNLQEDSASLTKWLPDEWGYSDEYHSKLSDISKLLYEHDESEEYDEEVQEENQEMFLEAVTSAFQHLIEEKVFGENCEDITFFISMSDDEQAEEIENYSAKLLNSPKIYEAFVNREIL